MESETRDPEGLRAAEIERYRERIDNLRECFRTSALINSTLELDQVLENIMTTSRSILKADACSLMLVDEVTDELVFAVAQGPVAGKLKAGFRLRKGDGIAGHVFESGKPLLIEDVYRDARFHQEFDRKTGYRTHSMLCVPLKIKDRVIGVSQVINRLDGTSFVAEDEETLGLLCDHAAIAIENARMHRDLLRKQQMESDLAFATSVQLSFLPQSIPEMPGYTFHAHYRPALAIGGDFYDFIPLDGDRLGILIGDVSGKGVASALCMAKLMSDFRLLAVREKEPAILMRQMNRLLFEQSRRGMFVTLLYMVLGSSDSKIDYVNAGHIPPVLWNEAGGEFVPVRGVSGPPLGILDDCAYVSRSLRLKRGDRLLLFTDGLVDAKSACGERFGWERVQAAVCPARGGIAEVHRRLMDALNEFVGQCPPADDTTTVLIGVGKP
ncbi:MAG TPA: SpoIIE family protein phosphatase [Syntrophobacter fumaroxidans]|nr:SpoIIE family protein phosphatase [Syntrophobacter fumaroxidans]